LVSTYYFLALSAAGLIIFVSVAHTFKFKDLPFMQEGGRRATLLSIAMLLSGLILISTELGRPSNIPNVFLTPNPRSAIWGTMMVFLVLLVISILMLILLRRRSPILSVAAPFAIFMGILATSTQGSELGLAMVRPFWAGTYSPLFFMLMALVSAIAIFFLICSLHWWTTGELDRLAGLLIKPQAILITALVISQAWRTFVGLYGSPSTAESFQYLLFGPLSSLSLLAFALGFILPLMLIAHTKARNARGLLISSILVLLGIYSTHYMNLVTGQVWPQFQGVWVAKYAEYAPTWVEGLIVVGAFSLVSFLYIVGQRFLLARPGKEPS
jgi:molybdopterin-containing oxidoreductase family membrane subunit